MRATNLAACFVLILMAAVPRTRDAVAQSSERPDLFTRLDADANGRLEADEIGEDQKRAFQQLLRVADANSDGTVTREEFMNGLKERNVSGAADAESAVQQSRLQLFNMLKRFDQNGDNRLTRDEIPEQFRERILPLFERMKTDSIDLSAVERIPAGPRQDAGRSRVLIQFDKNRDGRLEFSEIPERARPFLKRLWENAGKPITEPLEESDLLPGPSRQSNPDRPEVRSADVMVERPDSRPQISGPEADAVHLDSWRLMFRTLDADSNGRISKTEVARLQRVLLRLDRNSDGEIELQEFARLSAESQAGEQPGPRTSDDGAAEELPAVLRRFDQNQDGELTRDEAPEQLQTRFDRIDRNGDGRVTGREVQQALRAR